MKKRWSLLLALTIIIQSFAAMYAPQASAASKMTQYRVYQNDKALKEFSTEAEAVRYAKQFNYSHVEKIASRSWVWDNPPRYKVYQNGKSSSKWDFQTYNDAFAFAKTLSNVHIRDLNSIGWVYSSYPQYQLYQGDKSLAGWSFTTLDAAKKEAKKWANAHIIDLNTNSWIWDNLTDAQRKAQKEAAAVYEIIVNGVKAPDTKAYSFLKDAIDASLKIANSEVRNAKSKAIIHSNKASYKVLQNGKQIFEFATLQQAVKDAKRWANSEVVFEGNVLWSGYPYYTVYQGEKKLKHFTTRQAAVDYAKGYSNSTARTLDERIIWSNIKSLIYLGWNGSSAAATIHNHVANTQGLNIDSPTWFELTKADGTLKDSSNPAVVKALHDKGVLVMPLIHNQFDRTMTSEFLANSEAQKKFITALVNRLAALGVYGVNIDFEEVSGKDRKAYTAFVTKLAEAAHAKKLKVSIDLPRGSVSWNHLTAYDHAALAPVVDMIMIMAYDEHWSGSDKAGSVASLPWVEEGIKQFLDYGIPRDKLMLGIPFYVREWRLDSTGKLVDNRAIIMKELPKLIAETGASKIYDAAAGQYKYSYVKNGYTHLFWAETEDTVLARINLAKKYDLAGVAAWRLGYESNELWTKMLRAK